MEQIQEWIKKLLVTAAPAALAGYFGALAAPFGLLVLANLMDYLTGMAAAPSRGQQRSSEKGWRGIAKKVCMWLLVVVGVMCDAVLAGVGRALGWHTPFRVAIACLVCVWLLANEMISILENMDDMGVPVPGFLRKVIAWLKSRAGQEEGNA